MTYNKNDHAAVSEESSCFDHQNQQVLLISYHDKNREKRGEKRLL
ncbi:hypothetical protein PORCAN_872 [Porphyromonas crevioricanis JCM 13913]|nr:hypothetical protein PORCAN_872 [Porphyromonas crevioricanis JCM 13913]